MTYSFFLLHDLSFDFKLKIPGDKLDIKIDDHDGEPWRTVLTCSGKPPSPSSKSVDGC